MDNLDDDAIDEAVERFEQSLRSALKNTDLDKASGETMNFEFRNLDFELVEKFRVSFDEFVDWEAEKG